LTWDGLIEIVIYSSRGMSISFLSRK